MASTFQKLVRNQSATRIITTFNTPQQPILITQSLFSHLSETKPPHHCPNNPTHFFDLPLTEKLSHLPVPSSQFYPSYPFGFFLNPIYSTGSVSPGSDGVVSGDSKTIWADSVKKKRKRKMNKHKLRKLRKRLRRKT